MDLQDIFQQRVILKEVSYAYAYLDNPRIVYFKTSRTSMPSLIVMSDESQLLNTSSVTFIVLASKKIKEAITKAYSTYSDEYTTDQKFAIRDLHLYLRRLTPEGIEAFRKFPEFFKFTKLEGREKIYRYLTTDLKMPVSLFTKYFGEFTPSNDQHDGDHVEKFHGATLIFTESIRPNRKKSLLEMLQNVYGHLNSVGLSRLFSGDIRFVDIGAKYLGQYFLSSHDMRIRPSANNSKQVVFTVIHEFGHKFYYEFMTEEQRNAVRNQYNSLVKSGKRIVAGIKFANQKSNKILDIHAGSFLIYTGKKKAYKEIGRFEVLSVIAGKVSIRGEGERFTLNGPIEIFVAPNWALEGQTNQNYDTPDSEEKYDRISDSWFPTEYSMTEVEEWWAENFAFFVLGHIHNKEVHDWFSQFIK